MAGSERSLPEFRLIGGEGSGCEEEYRCKSERRCFVAEDAELDFNAGNLGATGLRWWDRGRVLTEISGLHMGSLEPG